MSIDEKLAIPFYRVGLERLTFTEILERFVDPSKKVEISTAFRTCM